MNLSSSTFDLKFEKSHTGRKAATSRLANTPRPKNKVAASRTHREEPLHNGACFFIPFHPQSWSINGLLKLQTAINWTGLSLDRPR